MAASKHGAKVIGKTGPAPVTHALSLTYIKSSKGGLAARFKMVPISRAQEQAS